jgi:hypothetical protein
LYIDDKNDINWGLTLMNIGTQFTSYDGTREKLPFEIIAGVSQELENVPIRWHFTLENLQQWNLAFSNPVRSQTSLDGSITEENISVLNNAMRHMIFGLELFPKKAFNLRLGYNFRRGAELQIQDQRNFSGLSLGFGLKLNKLKFNYSYSKYTLAGNTSLFGLTINLGE